MGKSLVRVFLLLFLTNLTTESQVLKGRITDKSGQPVQYATVFIQELRQGTTSNTKGDYEVRLPAGKYTVLYQSLGYEPVIDGYTTLRHSGYPRCNFHGAVL